MPPGASEIRHLNTQSRQFFFVIEGSLSIEVEGQVEVLTVGQGLEISPGERHRVFNEASRSAMFLVISHPPSHGDRVPAE
jgi:mannose-6-phosphate isomerase-like protein (cupin superfamily)